MKQVKFYVFCACIFVTMVLSSCKACKTNTEKVIKNDKIRCVFVKNETGELINDIILFTSDGLEVTKMNYEDITGSDFDEASIPIKISPSWDKYSDFFICAIDRYGVEYRSQNVVVEVPYGKSTVSLSESDKIKESIGARIFKFFNNTK